MTLMVRFLLSSLVHLWLTHVDLVQMSSSPGIVSFPFVMDAAHTLSLPQSAFPKSDSNLFEWVGTIEGPVGTVRVF
jgi:hypothetical protein